MPRRIAGQRRRPETDPEVNPQIDPIAPVTQATSGAHEASPVQDSVPSPTTKSDESSRIELSTDPAPAVGAPAPARSRVGVVLSAALGVLLVLILTLTALIGVKAWKGKEAEDARDQAAAAGRKAAETALSYDYRTLDKSFAAARATMTPEFAGQFDATAKVAGELATKTKATVRAEVREVGVRDGDADRVTLIIFVNQTTTSTITKGSPRVDLNRTRFTMVRNGGQWLVQEIAGL
ncbi:MAG: Mce-associated rane protein [Kribbellaceae bacterium]|nr:Mce-associated rane protein [Kribbellaceae bacterium]